MIDCARLRERAETNMPATLEAIQQAEKTLQHKFPPNYVELLRCSNGLTCFTWNEVHELENDILFYALNEIEERNETFEIRRYVPKWLLIGDNGGLQGVFIDTSIPDGAVYRLDLGALDYSYAKELAPSLSDWIADDLDWHDTEPHLPMEVDVWLIRAPINGAKGLIQIKNHLNLPTRIIELHAALKHLPYRLLRAAPIGYARTCEEYNKMDDCLAVSEVDQPDRPVL